MEQIFSGIKADKMLIDAHVHIFRDNCSHYSVEVIHPFIEQAQKNGLDEIYLLEHTHQFSDFQEMYQPVINYNEYQKNWLSQKMKTPLESYLRFIEAAKACEFPIQVKFGLEVCYIPETALILAEILQQYSWDFITGSVHYIDGWGFDHKAEFWEGVEVEWAYRRYYEIMVDLINSRLFTGLAHPDSIKCFGHVPMTDLTETYLALAKALNKAGMYAEQSGGLALNYGFSELGLNPKMLNVFQENRVRLLPASDAHRPEHTGANIEELMTLMR